MLIEPPAPPFASLVDIVSAPLLPLDADPVFNARFPLTPPVMDDAVRNVKAPDDVIDGPVESDTDPPVTELPPASTTIRPPEPVVPPPTITLTLPDAPLPFDPPLFIVIDPLLPDDAEPVLNESDPGVPVVPAFAVRTLNDPLVLADP